ncbi:Palmitoyltransferase [Tieghemiomyces parasiticus]|uniref:Palmitoyltransferase n=1 Tax=Tieghemiomyces parasiticus TaxID=78921 RepID=A0A9W7ZU19_9FUNG|nr:Palmitoyltransferase [Tieghemiomyces parasiticus]
MQLGPLVVTGVCLLIAFIGLTSQFFVLWGFHGGWTLETLMVLGPFNILLALLCYNFYLACASDPGSVPMGYEPPTSEGKVLVIEVKKNTAGPRYCRTCKRFKPPRAHHCSTCQRCVLKMDHHCPWINNCVGYGNYGHFFRFIVYVDLACSYVLCALVARVWFVYDRRDDYNVYYTIMPQQTEVLFLIFNFILATVVLLLVGILTIYHAWLVWDNTTTIETMEIGRIRKMVRRRIVGELQYPYDLGPVKNFKQILGPSVWRWLWPQPMPIDGGLTFPIAPHLNPPVYWPPLESTSYEVSTTCTNTGTSGDGHLGRAARSRQRRARPFAHTERNPESYALPTISSRVREQMVHVHVDDECPVSTRPYDSGEGSDVITDDYSVDTYDSDDEYDPAAASDEDDMALLNRQIDRLAESNGYHPSLQRHDSGLSAPGPSPSYPPPSHSSTIDPLLASPSRGQTEGEATIFMDGEPVPVQFTRGSLLDRLERKGQ